MISPFFRRFRDRLRSAGLWQGITLAVVAAWAVDHQLTVRALMQPMRFVIMDSRGTFYLTRAGTFDQATDIHADLARLAVETLFARSPSGLDEADRMKRLFSPYTQAQVQALLATDASEFERQHIHQKFEWEGCRELQIESESVTMSVSGQLVRTSQFTGQQIGVSKPVTVYLKMIPNDAMQDVGKYPLVVMKFVVKWA